MRLALNSLRTVAGAAVLLLMSAAAFQPIFVRAWVVGGAALHDGDKVYEPDRGYPGFREFLDGVAVRTPPGASIALVVPMESWRGGYAYAYHRASFLLAGRRVLPLVSHEERSLPQNVDRAEYIAAWNVSTIQGVRPVWSAGGGTLYMRSRR